MYEIGVANVTLASKVTASSVKWSGAFGALWNVKLWASIAIDDIVLKGHYLGGVIGLVHKGATITLVNCIGNVILPTFGLNIGTTAGEVFDGTINGIK